MKKMFNIKPSKNPVSNFGRAIKFGASSLSRNKYLTIATIILMAVIIFIFNIILSVNFIIHFALDDLTQKVDLVVYLKSEIKYNQVEQMMNELEDLPGIVDVSYTSKNDALDIVLKTHPETLELLESNDIDNPLPPSLNIITEKPEYHTMVQQFLAQEQYRSLVSQDLNAEEKVKKANEVITNNLIQLSNVTNQIIFWVSIIFLIGTFVIIINAIHLTMHHRKVEVYIMRLVGATRNFIRLPFLFEGFIYSLFAALLSFAIYSVIASQININQTSLGNYFIQIPFLLVSIIELFAIILFGLLASFFAVQKYLNSKLILGK